MLRRHLPFVLQKYFVCLLYFRGTISIICQITPWKGQCNAAIEKQFSNHFGLRMPFHSYFKGVLFMCINIYDITSEMKAEKNLKTFIHLKNNNPLFLNINNAFNLNSYTPSQNTRWKGGIILHFLKFLPCLV